MTALGMDYAAVAGSEFLKTRVAEALVKTLISFSSTLDTIDITTEFELERRAN
jgi:hypothetical protein